MAKKKAARPKMPSVLSTPKAPVRLGEVRHIQIQIPVGPYERGKELAAANGLSMNAYVRQAILQRIRQDSEAMKGGGR